jgi:hypothetical protein
VLDYLRKYHDHHFSYFSTLIRDSFDNAVVNFSDHSIDILHIDGLHTYEAVRHDYESWRPKLSDRGVVLFHDIRVFNNNFGVHRLWNELSPAFPHFEFFHGNGLGVLIVGKDAPEPARSLCESPDAPSIRKLFHRLGSLQCKFHEADTEKKAALKKLADCEVSAAIFKSRADSNKTILESIHEIKQEYRLMLDEANDRLLKNQARMESLLIELARSRDSLLEKEKQMQILERKKEEALAFQLQYMNKVQRMGQSLSWRLTSPLRALRRLVWK